VIRSSLAACILLASVALGAECASPPVEKPEQAICLLRDFKRVWPLTDWLALQPSFARADDSWIVSFEDPISFGSGAFAKLNAASGVVTQRLSYLNP